MWRIAGCRAKHTQEVAAAVAGFSGQAVQVEIGIQIVHALDHALQKMARKSGRLWHRLQFLRRGQREEANCDRVRQMLGVESAKLTSLNCFRVEKGDELGYREVFDVEPSAQFADDWLI